MSLPLRHRLRRGASFAITLTIALALRVAAADVSLAPVAPDKPWPLPSPAEIAARESVVIYGPLRRPGEATEQAQSLAVERGRRYTLGELIDLAQRINPETREAWEQARQAALAVGLVESSYAPQISIEVIGGFQRTPLPIPNTVYPPGFFVSNTYQAIPSVGLKWLLFDFGRRDAQDETARANSFVANVAFTGTHQKLVYTVSRAYFSLGAARGRMTAAQQALKTADTVQDAAQARRERGLTTVVVVAQSQRQTAQARLNLAKASGEERTAYASLVAAIGLPADTQIDIVDTSAQPLPAEPPENLSALVQKALRRRPDVIAALGKIDAAEGELKSRRADYYPSIAVSGSLYQNIGGFNTDGSPYSSVNKPGGSILLTLSVPMYDGGARGGREAVAQSQLAAAREKLAEVRDAAAQQVVSAYSDLRTSLAAYAAALTVREAAQISYDAAFDAFQHGVGTYTDVATEQTALARADAEKEDAHANVFTAAAALAFATGTIQDR